MVEKGGKIKVFDGVTLRGHRDGETVRDGGVCRERLDFFREKTESGRDLVAFVGWLTLWFVEDLGRAGKNETSEKLCVYFWAVLIEELE